MHMWEVNFKHKTPKIGKYFQILIWPHVGKACSGWAFYSLGIREYFPSKRLILPYCTKIKLKNNSGSIFNGWIVRKFVFSKPPSRNLKNPDHLQSDQSLITTDINILIILLLLLIIIITRPKPAYGRQGLAGLWGQDTDQAGTFWGVVNIIN